jgi:hypothetical protein
VPGVQALDIGAAVDEGKAPAELLAAMPARGELRLWKAAQLRRHGGAENRDRPGRMEAALAQLDGRRDRPVTVS